MPNIPGFGVFNGLAPEGGPKALPVALDFSATTQIVFDLVKEQDADGINFIQSCWIDNSQSPRRLDIDVNGVPFRLSVPIGAMGMFPIIHPGHFRCTFTVSAFVPAIKIPLIFLNVPMPSFVYLPGVV
jgi:hypothetical protein